eukprot:CAMPEP_0118656960 /NCGR_PEP_ID=MMETSP0785-20121206/13758_1 /TAXON_ID=91992 /ORGANISM="Bolidomonas pacifica, Strain CCMP 1866" /LENGTH=58 /DNA_ID=CAMNT_0006549835 /DNA_START=774 /DNA_END=950 /DNA_ORIENTATION=+
MDYLADGSETSVVKVNVVIIINEELCRSSFRSCCCERYRALQIALDPSGIISNGIIPV